MSPTGVYVTLTRKLRSASKSVGAGGVFCFFLSGLPQQLKRSHVSLIEICELQQNFLLLFC